MNQIEWSLAAQDDLIRLFDFLSNSNVRAAARVIDVLTAAPERLRDHPRLGEKLPAFGPRDVRRLIVGSYELRYEVSPDLIVVLRIFHGKEDRS